MSTILNGSVRRAGSRVRIVAQLIEADSDKPLWSETFDRDLTDIFAAFQRAIELSPSNADAWDHYGRLTSVLERFDESLEQVRRAHELDPLTHRVDVVTALLRAGRLA